MQTAREGLAFLRVLLGDDETGRMRSFGVAYLSAGVIYRYWRDVIAARPITSEGRADTVRWGAPV
jgi:hypothetical protein